MCLAFEVAAVGKDLNLISQTKNSGISGIRPNTYSSFFFFSPAQLQLQIQWSLEGRWL